MNSQGVGANNEGEIWKYKIVESKKKKSGEGRSKKTDADKIFN